MATRATCEVAFERAKNMCFTCTSSGLNRRSFFKLGAAGAAAAFAGLALTTPSLAAQSTSPALSPDQALDRLMEGNKKFVIDAGACAANFAVRRRDLTSGQAPWAIVLSCADSRVVPELVFGGVTLGELFVARNAGNVVDTNILGAIEYGVEHLHAPIVMVLGHSRCGAVSAACDMASKGTRIDGSVGKMLLPILPVALAETNRSEGFIDRTARANAVNGAERIIAESAIVSHLVDEGKVKVVPAFYDLETGAVDLIHKV